MAKKKGNLFGATVEYTKTNKGTSIGRKPYSFKDIATFSIAESFNFLGLFS